MHKERQATTSVERSPDVEKSMDKIYYPAEG